MLKEKQKIAYLETKQYQKDCTEFNKELCDLLSDYVNNMSQLKFDKFSEVVLPTILIHHISNYFEHHLIKSEESVDAFVESIKDTIMDNCGIEHECNDYKFIEDLGAIA
tara:strand:- start:876 stop:1202 length:327 start_codon:yes stop_codon:yes gene_type:complete